ncbi:MAG: hypothetical protein U9R54_03010, partial [Bacteroidota bacterium]|nr:hypothetical protein [Bacteroidota bacterium]
MDENKKHVDNNRLIAESKERLKELSCINRTTSIIRESKSIEETLNKIVLLLPEAWQYPEFTVAQITYNNKKFVSPRFINTEWSLKQSFETIDGDIGVIQVCYIKELPISFEGPFLKEERELLNNISNLILGHVNGVKAK